MLRIVLKQEEKSIGTKRNDITDKCRDLIVKAYGAFENGTIYGEKDGIYCQSKILIQRNLDIRRL